MIRNVKLVVLAAMAFTALSAVGASGAQASGEQFHCSVQNCVFTPHPDEAAGTKTAHHVFVLTNSLGESNSITCNQITGHGKGTFETETTLTLTNIAYDTCTFVGQKTEVKMNGCTYVFSSETGAVNVVCPGEAKISFEVPGCKVEVGSQSLSGITYHNIGTKGVDTRVTVSTAVTGIAATMTGTKAACGGVTPTATPVVGNYTTGNTIVKATTEAGGQADGWWA
jgi:hypothetical protein